MCDYSEKSKLIKPDDGYIGGLYDSEKRASSCCDL